MSYYMEWKRATYRVALKRRIRAAGYPIASDASTERLERVKEMIEEVGS